MTTKQLAKQERDKNLWKAGKLCAKLTHRYGFWLDVSVSISLNVKSKKPNICLDLLQFSRVKNIVRFSDWPELIFVRKFTTKRLSKYIAVCIKQVLKLFCKCYLHS